VAVGLAFTAWQVTRAGHVSPAPPVSVPAPSPLVPVGSPGPTEGPPTATTTDAGPSPPGPSGPRTGAAGSAGSATGSVVVDVTGKFRRPGIATLPPGSRVVDALEAAGGARRGVALTSLNLARVLSDGEQIVVGVESPSGVAASAASVPSGSSTGAAVPMVNINTAGQAELEQLPGIGPVTALAILDFRSQQGRFTSVEELLEVSGIGDATLAKIAPYVTL
jgi:competence protein ComEA